MDKKYRFILFFFSCIIFLFNPNPAFSQKDSLSAGNKDSLSFELLVAAADNDLDRSKELIERGADINWASYYGVTPLMYAAENGNEAMLIYFIYKGANINAKPSNGITALMVACINGHEDIADYLIREGANIYSKDYDKLQCIHYTAAYGYYILTDMLLFYGADINARDYQGNTPLMLATYSGYTEIVSLLLEKGADPDYADIQGNTTLMLAAQKGFLDIVEILLTYHAGLNYLNNRDYSALTIAVLNKQGHIVKYLLEQGADQTAGFKNNNALLNIAIAKRDNEIIKLLSNESIKKELMPYFSKLIIDIKSSFNHRDYLIGGGTGIYDAKHGLAFSLGYQTRPWAKRTLQEIQHPVYYQLWENRSWLYSELTKDFILSSRPFSNHGLFLGLKGVYSWANYHGTEKKQEGALYMVPEFGWLSEHHWLGFRFSYEYFDLNTYKLPPHRINVSLLFYIQTRSHTYYEKNISWL